MIKSEMKNEKPVSFPILMQSKWTPKLVVLFTTFSKGTVVSTHDRDLYMVGMHRDDLFFSSFEPLKGPLVIRELGGVLADDDTLLWYGKQGVEEIVLLDEPDTPCGGTVVYIKGLHAGDYPVGTYRTNWELDLMHLRSEHVVVTLENVDD